MFFVLMFVYQNQRKLNTEKCKSSVNFYIVLIFIFCTRGVF